MEPVYRKGKCGGVRTGVTMGSLFLKPRFSDWCYDAVREVKFAPDRKAISEELTAHYEDHVQALLDIGYEKGEAEAKALEAMGDAHEVGRALNKVHNFWLGVLWKISQILLIVLLLALPIQICHQWGWFPLIERTTAELSYQSPPPWAARTTIPSGTVYLAASDEVTIDEESNDPVYHATLWVELDRPSPGYHDRSHLIFTDQEGEISREWRKSDLEPENPYYGWIKYADAQGWMRQKLDICLKLDHAPEYLTITQPYGESPWSIRCDWEVGE